MFNHLEIEIPRLERNTVDGVRYYETPNTKMVSITSIISFYNREIFIKWRKRVGEEAANLKTRLSTSRGTDMHTVTEHYLKNDTLPKVKPLPEFLFKIAKPDLNRISNIHTLEGSLYSEQLGVAGTVDRIAEYDGELAVIDFKTSAKPKPYKWIEGYLVQCAAYACMYYELTGTPVKKFVIIMACEDGSCKVYQEYDKLKYMKLLTKYIRNFAEYHLNGK